MTLTAAFKDALRCTTIGVVPDLRCINQKGRPLVSCPKWYQEAIEQADLAYQINTGWKLTDKGRHILNGGSF